MPAPPLVVTNAGLLRLLWSLEDVLGINVLGFLKIGGIAITQALANAVGAAIKAQFTSQLAPHISDNSHLVKVGIRDISSPNMPEYIDNGAAVPGLEATTDPLPRGSALNVTLRTGQSGKSFRGRCYLGGFTEAANTPNAEVDPAVQSAALAFLNGVQTAMGTSGLDLAVISRPAYARQVTETWFGAAPGGGDLTIIKSNTAARAGGVTPVELLEARDARWEYQRRRDNGRGAAPVSLFGVARLPLATGVVELGGPFAENADLGSVRGRPGRTVGSPRRESQLQ